MNPLPSSNCYPTHSPSHHGLDGGQDSMTSRCHKSSPDLAPTHPRWPLVLYDWTTPCRCSDTNRPGSANQQHRPNQLKHLMNVLYNTDTAIKERLKTGRGYRVESCGLWCHGLLVFKQHLVSIKTAFMSASVDRKWWWRDDLLNQDFMQTSGGQWDYLPLPKNTSDVTSFFFFFSNAEKMHK